MSQSDKTQEINRIFNFLEEKYQGNISKLRLLKVIKANIIAVLRCTGFSVIHLCQLELWRTAKLVNECEEFLMVNTSNKGALGWNGKQRLSLESVYEDVDHFTLLKDDDFCKNLCQNLMTELCVEALSTSQKSEIKQGEDIQKIIVKVTQTATKAATEAATRAILKELKSSRFVFTRVPEVTDGSCSTGSEESVKAMIHGHPSLTLVKGPPKSSQPQSDANSGSNSIWSPPCTIL